MTAQGDAPDLQRRRFLQAGGAAGAGLVLGFTLPACRKDEEPPASAADEAAPPPEPATAPARADGPVVNGWLRIGTDDHVTLLVPEAEMGQGVLTAFAMIAADELGADWAKMHAEHAPLDPERFGRQSTGGSTSVRQGFEPLRRVAAQARAMLVEAAAERLGVDAARLTVADGQVRDAGSDRALSFGALATAAAGKQPPREPTLRPREEWKLIGTRQRRLDAPAKTRGEATFGLDVQVDGMVHAAIARCPIHGGALEGFDAAGAKAVPGVTDVVEVPGGVAVVAAHTWAALEGRKKLDVRWKPGPAGAVDDATIEAELTRVVDGGDEVRRDGDPDRALRAAPAARKLEATYRFPFLAHACMEPLGCTARVHDGGVELWVATQSPSGVARAVQEVAGVPRDRVTVHVPFLGGGFGRRSQSDFVEEAVALSKKLGKTVKITWTREDDTRGGRYRPGGLARFAGAVDADGRPVAWSHRLATAPIGRSAGADGTAVSGAADLPYAIPNVSVRYARPELPITTWYWRSVGHSQNGWMVEGFLDELLALGGQDPVEGRLALLGDRPRHRRVLEVAAERAGWGGAVPEGHALGVAVCEGYGSFVAEVADVSIDGGRPRVHRVVSAIDCGDVVNPDTVEAQVEGAIAYGLSAALHQRLTFRDGRTVESNFHDYPIVRMSEMPAVETHVVRSGEALGGVGEPGLPPIAPAVGGAVRALTGRPVRSLPIRLGDADDATAGA